MITEDYVSFETAKLLKEKGFDECCYLHYHYNESFDRWFKTSEYIDSRFKKYYYPCPTLQMAMKWLREVHNINISIFPHSHKDYEFVYWNGEEYHVPYDEKHPTYHELFGKTWEKYEKACEAAIKYCLENLI